MVKNPKFLSFIAWLTGVLVSLAVGFAMVDQVLYIWWVPILITQIAGWIVIVTTVVSVILALIKN